MRDPLLAEAKLIVYKGWLFLMEGQEWVKKL